MRRRRIIAWTGVALLGVVLVGGWLAFFPGEPRREPPEPPRVTAFEEIPVPFVHRWDTERTHGFLGAAAIDVDGDGHMETFLGGGLDQDDVLLAWRDGTLVDVIEGTGLSDPGATYGASAIDMDADGDTDLLVGRSDGITLYLNEAGRFSPHPIDAGLPDQTDPFAISVADPDGDGDGDLYVSGFVSLPAFVGLTFNDPAVVRPNRMLRNDGLHDGVPRFSDVTEATGLAGRYNTFQSVWTDLDLDGDQDLVTAPNTGRVEVFRNDTARGGELRFTELPPASPYGFWMAAAVGDVDADGDQDLMFTNAGNVVPRFLLTGDLRDDQPFTEQWLLLRNDGLDGEQLRLTDVTAEYQLDGYGFAWGAAFTDLDADGHLDLVVSKNAEKLFNHRIEALRPSSNAFLQLADGEGGRAFYDVAALALQRPDYGMSPLLLDLDDDGAIDVVMPNQNQAARAHLARDESPRLVVCMPDTVAALGARVTVVTDAGRSPTQEMLSSVGFMTDHSPHLGFGLGEGRTIDRVEVRWLDGEVTTIAGETIEDGQVTVSRR